MPDALSDYGDYLCHLDYIPKKKVTNLKLALVSSWS